MWLCTVLLLLAWCVYLGFVVFVVGSGWFSFGLGDLMFWVVC